MFRFIARLVASAAIVAAVVWFQPETVEPSAMVSHGLNLRSAPDRRAPRVAVLPVGTTVEVQRCLDDLKWCEVRHGDRRGWASADYLVASSDGRRVRMAEAGRAMGVVIEPASSGG